MADLQWHEPASYRWALYLEHERQRPLESLAFAGVAFLVLLGLRWVVGLHPAPDAHPPGWGVTALVALAGAAFAAYGLPALAARLPSSIVIFSRKGVNNNVLAGRGWHIRFWAWERIDRCTLGRRVVKGRTYPVLHLRGARGEVLATLALRDRPSLREIEAYLGAQGKRLERET